MTGVRASETARRAMSAVEQGARDEWVALFAPGATLEDPVDDSPGLVGTDAITQFWDTGIALFEQVEFDVHRVHEAPGEALVLCDVSVRVAGGAHARYDAAVHYQLNENGEIDSLRAFWDLPSMLAQLSGE